MESKRELQLDRVVLLGRTFEEYRRYFLLEPQELIGKTVLDAALRRTTSGFKVTAFDPIYSLSREKIMEQSAPDLESVYRSIGLVPTYRWVVSYLLFAYQDRLNYEFHSDSILEIMRVTRGEARIYPTVTFEANTFQCCNPIRRCRRLNSQKSKQISSFW